MIDDYIFWLTLNPRPPSLSTLIPSVKINAPLISTYMNRLPPEPSFFHDKLTKQRVSKRCHLLAVRQFFLRWLEVLLEPGEHLAVREFSCSYTVLASVALISNRAAYMIVLLMKEIPIMNNHEGTTAKAQRT
jgi:hypothetical protein